MAYDSILYDAMLTYNDDGDSWLPLSVNDIVKYLQQDSQMEHWKGTIQFTEATPNQPCVGLIKADGIDYLIETNISSKPFLRVIFDKEFKPTESTNSKVFEFIEKCVMKVYEEATK
jgi:hypothetical protein